MRRLPVIIFIAIFGLCLSAQAEDADWVGHTVLDPQQNQVYRIKSLDSEHKWAELIEFWKYHNEDAVIERRRFKDLVPALTDVQLWGKAFLHHGRPIRAEAVFPGKLMFGLDFSNERNPVPVVAPVEEFIPEISPRSPLDYRRVRDEQGTQWTLQHHFEGDKVYLSSPSRDIRPPNLVRDLSGLHVFPTNEVQLFNLRLKLPPAALDLFEDMRNGRTLDLNDPSQLTLFKAYLTLNLHSVPRGAEQTLIEFLREHQVPAKLQLGSAEIESTSGARLRLRPLPLQLAPYRGCLGHDCSTQTRFLRALEPAHMNFAIEGVPYEPLGQIEIVLGHSEDGQRRLAFFERIQSPNTMRPHHVEALVVAVKHLLEEQGVTLVTLENVEMYTELGHPISNNRGVTALFERAIQKRFTLENPMRFHRDPDLFTEVDPRGLNLIARRTEEHKVNVFRIKDMAEELPDRIKSIQYLKPKSTFAPLDFNKIAIELKAHLQSEIENARTSDFSDSFIADLLEKFPGCEAQLSPQLRRAN